VLDFGAASPLGILAAARNLCQVVFLCDRDRPYVRAQADELEALGDVCDVTGLGGTELLDRVERLHLDGVTTFSEAQITRTAALASPRGLPYPTPECARALTDKLVQRRVLAEAGVQATRCHLVHGPADLDAALAAVGLPAVLKPRSGAASAYTCQVDTPGEAAARLREFTGGPAVEGFVLEELLTGDPAAAGPEWGDYVSVESVTSAGVVRHVEVTGKLPLAPPFRETGYFVPASLGAALRRQVLDLTEAAVTALGVRFGVTHVEVKLTPDGPRLIEVNGRVGGYVAQLVRRARGYDLLRAALLAALGRPCPVPPAVYRRLAFQYFITPPMDAVALRRLDGVEELLHRPGIQTVERFCGPGDPLDWRRGTLTYLGIVHGTASDHEDLGRVLRAVRTTLHADYERA
jgi:biotin carboxylase